MRDERFERLYAEHAQALFGFLSYRTGDRVLAEDLLADTFERALRARSRFDRRRASEKTWLYTIALNLLRDNARRSTARSRALERIAVGDQVSSDQRDFDSIEQRDSLQAALARLSSEEGEVIALRYGADLTVPEIAKLTHEKLSTVEGRVYRALRKLKNELN